MSNFIDQRSVANCIHETLKRDASSHYRTWLKPFEVIDKPKATLISVQQNGQRCHCPWDVYWR